MRLPLLSLLLPLLLPLLLLLGAQPAAAHEVQHRIAVEPAAVVQLAYADGQAFAYEKYELYADGREVPVQVGNTDAAGRVSFVPGTAKNWRLRAFSADGHGVDLRFETPVGGAAASIAAATNANAAPRWQIALTGLALLFGAFGTWQLFFNRRKRRE